MKYPNVDGVESVSPDRGWATLAVWIAGVGLRRELCRRPRPLALFIAHALWASRSSIPPRCTDSGRASGSARRSATSAKTSRWPARSSWSRHSPRYIKQRERASARRLQLEHIPLYQVHQPNPVVPDSVIMPGMRDLLIVGLLGRLGVSERFAIPLEAAGRCRTGRPVISNQVSFSLAHPECPGRPGSVRRAGEPRGDRLQPTGAGTPWAASTAWSGPAACAQSTDCSVPRATSAASSRCCRPVRDVAKDVDAKPAQVALAWLISLPNVVAIPGGIQCRAARIQRRRSRYRAERELPRRAYRCGPRIPAGVDAALPDGHDPGAAQQPLSFRFS